MTPPRGDVCRLRERPDADDSSTPWCAATNVHLGLGANWAVTCSSGKGKTPDGLTWQVLVPEQAPLQPAKLEPGPGVAISDTC